MQSAVNHNNPEAVLEQVLVAAALHMDEQQHKPLGGQPHSRPLICLSINKLNKSLTFPGY